MSVATRSWYATAAHGRWQLVAGDRVREPATAVHAKQLGTNLAACGTVTTTWETFWASPLPIGRANECHDCARVVRSLTTHP